MQYFVFSDALTGAPLFRLEDSTARNGAVMLSAVVQVGSDQIRVGMASGMLTRRARALQAGRTRLLDNVMVCGSVDDIGVP